ncbi:hypothetical protein BDW60DRAFT_200570 [Aspergillus nidulans var. acristatus]
MPDSSILYATTPPGLISPYLVMPRLNLGTSSGFLSLADGMRNSFIERVNPFTACSILED